MKHSTAFGILLAAVGACLTGCASAPVIREYPVTGSNEILTNLSKITESENGTAHSVSTYKNGGILYSFTEGGFTNVYKKENPLTPATVQITSGNNYNYSPSYNPVTDRIMFSRYVKGGGSRDIYMLADSNASALIPITDTAGANEWEPSFSPDGNLVAYQKTPSNGTSLNVNSEIWVKNLKTGENMLLGQGFNPRISPDGKRIVYSKLGSTNNIMHIWVMNIDGTGATQLTTADDEWTRFPYWSPNGEFIIFQGLKRNIKNDFDIFVMRANGSDLRQITNNESADFRPIWAEDNFIYFISDRGAKADKYQVWRFKYNPY